MTFEEIFNHLSGKFGPAILEKGETKPDPYIKVEAQKVREVIQYLRDELKFETIGNLSGVDYPAENALVLVYHLQSYTHKTVVALKAVLPREENPRIASITSVYTGADWLERETYDMFGILFEGHPDMRRILMPDDWVGYPLRKDFVTPDYYNGMPVPLYFDENRPPEGSLPKEAE